MSSRWVRAVTLGLTLGLSLTGLAACSDDSGAAPGSKASAKAAIDPDVIVRFPRYWATTDQAESGAEAASNTRFFIGVDDQRLVYTGQDVIRLIDRDSGKQVRQTLIGADQVICAFPPDRKIDDHVLVVATGPAGTAGDADCQTVRGYDVEQGRFLWSHRLRNPGAIDLDTRDDSVLLTTKVQSPRDYQIGYGLSVLDLRTGRPRWSTTPQEAYAGRADPDLTSCSLRAGLAATRPVVVALAACNDFANSDDEVPHAVGYDLRTGKKQWSRSADWITASTSPVSYESVVPHPNDAAFFPATSQTGAGYVDPETGEGRAVPTPRVAQYAGSEDSSYEPCSDFGENGNTFADACVFPAADGILLYVNSRTADGGGSLRMEGVSEKTGERRFLVELKKPKPKAGDYVPAFTFLGLDDRRAEFWLSTDDVEVDRYSVRTGKRTGRGQLAPPLGLTQIAAMGPGYLAVRNQGGITGPTRNVLSGVDYYRTNTTE